MGTGCPQLLPMCQRLSGMLEEFVLFVLTQSISVCFLLPLGSSTGIWLQVDQPLGKAGGTCILLCPRALRLRHALQDRWWLLASQFLLWGLISLQTPRVPL